MAKIMLVDDSNFMRGIIKGYLKDIKDVSFVEAESAEKAISTYKKEKPDLVLLDIIIGKKESGIDVLSAIKKEDSTAKVIMVSVVNQEAVMKKAKDLGALGYVTKPVDKEKLLAEVNKALN